MGLFPRAPEVSVRLRGDVRAGQENEIEIVLTAREAVEVDFVEATLEVAEWWWGDDSRSARRDTVLRLGTRIVGKGVLAAGRHSHRRTFELPAATPPTLSLAWAKIECMLSVHVSIPWWPDPRKQFVVPVRAAARDLPAAPSLATNGASGGGVPRVEVSLASRDVAARGAVSGAVAFFHHDRSAVAGARLALRARTVLRTESGREIGREGVAYTVPLPPSPPVDGTPVPFRFRLPDDVAPTFRARVIALDWQLLVERPRTFGTDVWIAVPVAIHESPALDSATRGIDIPQLGDARLAAVLADVAERTGFRVEGGRLVAEEHRMRLAIVREQRAGGSVLVGTIELPAGGLGLGLVVERARPLAQLLVGDVEIGDRAFDEAHRIEAREDEQARALFSGGLVAAIPPGALVRLDDRAAVLEQRDATLDGAALASFARTIAAIAGALDRGIARVPPPAGIEIDREACAELAAALGERWTLGDLSIRGVLGESEVAIATQLEGERALVLEVRPAPAPPGDLEIRSASPRADGAALAEGHGAALAALVASLPETARALEIAGGIARVELPFETAPDLRGALRAAQVLSRIGAVLAPRRGPFR